jgi:glc operon protein GlcG
MSHPPGPRGTISLAQASAAIDAVVHEARQRGASIVVAVAAPSGDPIALARMDGCPPLAAESALRKCRTVALTWKSTADFAASLREDLATEPEYFHGMHHVGPPIMTIGGGVPVVVDDALSGIVAVSGSSTDDDVALAQLGAAAAAGAVDAGAEGAAGTR